MESQPQNPAFRKNPESFQSCIQGSRYKCIIKNIFNQNGGYVGTQKNCLKEMVLLSTQNTCLN